MKTIGTPMSACACHDPAGPDRTGRGLAAMARRLAAGVGCASPGLAFILVPKCPVCLAATVALWTGIGLSTTDAARVRTLLLAACVGSLVSLAGVLARALLRARVPRIRRSVKPWPRRSRSEESSSNSAARAGTMRP